MLLKGPTPSCQLALCDLHMLMPPSVVSHDCPNRVCEEPCTASCLHGNAAISVTAASAVLPFGSHGASMSDTTLPCPFCEAQTCSIGELLHNGSSSGPDFTSLTMDESCAAAGGTRICEGAAVELACLSGRCSYPRLRSPLYKWQCPLPEKRDRCNRDSYLPGSGTPSGRVPSGTPGGTRYWKIAPHMSLAT